MKWIYSIKYKLQAALVLTVIVFVVFAKNIIDRWNITELGRDFISFYDDRLVVESYIFEITEHLFLMKLSINKPDFQSDMLKEDLGFHHAQILEIIEDFEHTNLTRDEAAHLAQLKQKIQNNLQFTTEMADFDQQQDQVELFNQNFEDAFFHVKALSAIQLYEGGRLTEGSGRIVERSAIWAQLETAVLVILLVIIYLLIFSSQSIRSKVKQNSSLN